MPKFFYFAILLTLLIPLSALVSDNPDDLLNWCLDSRNHKHLPSPEDSLHRQCNPWANRSCCDLQTTVDAHYSKMYNFDYDHCKVVQVMSEKCRKHFVQDLCFYECSPNIGPWVVKVEQKIRRERFIDVPLCSNDCDAWFEDCAEDYTCTNNWGRNFDWVKGENRCPQGSSCKKFKDIFKTSEYFCENVWDHSWKYTPNSQNCMRLWFDGPNPNDKVAKYYVEKLRDQLPYRSSSMKINPTGYFVIPFFLSAIYFTF